MLSIEKKLKKIIEWEEVPKKDVLSLYIDVDPSKPENAEKAWLKRVKKALKELVENNKGNENLNESLIKDLSKNLEILLPSGKTLVCFAYKEKDELQYERFELNIELPLLDFRNQGVEIAYGRPYITPLLFAMDEYEKTGILVLNPQKWRFLEVYLGEVTEDEELFKEISGKDWEELHRLSKQISEEIEHRIQKRGGRFDKLSIKEREAAKVSTWMSKLYGKMARLLEKIVTADSIERLVFIGERWQLSYFETYLSTRMQNKIAAKLPLKPEIKEASPQNIWKYTEPVIYDIEREYEKRLLQQIKEQPGLWGIDPVLNALQMGRVRKWVIPWSLDITIWRCEKDGFVAASQDTAKIVCSDPKPVRLKECIYDLALTYGAEIEFVRGEAEEILLKEMDGMAALVRW